MCTCLKRCSAPLLNSWIEAQQPLPLSPAMVIVAINQT
jgi:hypothetical protein